MIEPDLEDRVEHIAGALVDMLGTLPGTTWPCVVRINRTTGWTYELPYYQAYPLTGRMEPLRIAGDRLDEVNLRRAWELALAVRETGPSP